MSKKFVITDIHGCASTFRKMVEEVLNVDKSDEIFLLGDFIDRGPDSKGVFDFIFELQSKGFTVNCLRGNHEQFLLEASDNLEEFKHWVVHNGGQTTLKSFSANTVKDIPIKYFNFIEELPYYFDLPDFLMVHAGFNFAAADPFSDKEAMLMIRDFPIDYDFLGGRKIIHGHTPTRLPQIIANVEDLKATQINLDAGCVYGNVPGLNHLVALELTEWKLFVTDCVDQIT